MKGPKILVVVGGALVALSSVLVWIIPGFVLIPSALDESDAGLGPENLDYLSSTYGKLALAVGLVLVVIGLGLFSQWGAQPVVAQAAVAIAAAAVVLAGLGMLDTNSRLADYMSIAKANAPERGAARSWTSSAACSLWGDRSPLSSAIAAPRLHPDAKRRGEDVTRVTSHRHPNASELAASTTMTSIGERRQEIEVRPGAVVDGR